jgi:ribosomal 50S subunit-recycling heat shock protein
MRIDLALKHLCLVKSRSIVKHLCEDGAVTINDRPARPAAVVRAGDHLAIRFPHRKLIIELVDVPGKQLSKSTAPTYYRIVSDEKTRDDDDYFD